MGLTIFPSADPVQTSRRRRGILIQKSQSNVFFDRVKIFLPALKTKYMTLNKPWLASKNSITINKEHKKGETFTHIHKIDLTSYFPFESALLDNIFG